MQDISSFFETATGLYSFYKWCQHDRIPKELFNLILLNFKNCPACIYCTLGCCRYGRGIHTYNKRSGRWVHRADHANNNISLRSLVGSLIDKHKQDPLNKAIIGKIIMIACTKNESTKIPETIVMFLDELCRTGSGFLWNRSRDKEEYFHIGSERYPMNIAEYNYEIIFCLIGRFFEYVKISGYPNKIVVPYGNYEYDRGDIKAYLSDVRMTCFSILYGIQVDRYYNESVQLFRYDILINLKEMINAMQP